MEVGPFKCHILLALIVVEHIKCGLRPRFKRNANQWLVNFVIIIIYDSVLRIDESPLLPVVKKEKADRICVFPVQITVRCWIVFVFTELNKAITQ